MKRKMDMNRLTSMDRWTVVVDVELEMGDMCDTHDGWQRESRLDSSLIETLACILLLFLHRDVGPKPFTPFPSGM
jgi:hypothetical protein